MSQAHSFNGSDGRESADDVEYDDDDQLVSYGSNGELDNVVNEDKPLTESGEAAYEDGSPYPISAREEELKEQQKFEEQQELAHQKVEQFLKEYKDSDASPLWERANLARRDCEEILREIHVKGIVQNRVKKRDSLATKLRGMVEGDDKDTMFIAWVASGGSIEEYSDMGDLVGIRIGLYLPSDFRDVADAISNKFKIVHLFGSVTGGRDTSPERHSSRNPMNNSDIGKHNHGPWYTQGNRKERWQHYGYRSWQVVAEFKGATTRDGDISLGRFEIQVGTIVTQAWAEVQHNIIYKRSEEIRATPAMKRMIDAINGMAITTEILLNELDGAEKEAEQQAEDERQRLFKNEDEFSRWFEQAYLEKMPPAERRRWVYPPRWADAMASGVACIPEGVKTDMAYGYVEFWLAITPNRISYQLYIEEHGLMEADTGTLPGALDISHLILEAKGFEFVIHEGWPRGGYWQWNRPYGPEIQRPYGPLNDTVFSVEAR